MIAVRVSRPKKVCAPRSPPALAHVGEVGRARLAAGGAQWLQAPRVVTTAARAVPVKQLRVNGRHIDPVSGERMRFSSAILPVWCRKLPVEQRDPVQVQSAQRGVVVGEAAGQR